MTTTTDEKFTIRLYQNSKYGRYFDMGKINKIVFNGTMEVLGIGKWVFDLTLLEDLEQACSTDDLVDLQSAIDDVLEKPEFSDASKTDILAAQFKYLEYVDGKSVKTYSRGIVIADTKSQLMKVILIDENRKVDIETSLLYHGCSSEKQGKKSPDFFASNYDHSVSNAA